MYLEPKLNNPPLCKSIKLRPSVGLSVLRQRICAFSLTYAPRQVSFIITFSKNWLYLYVSIKPIRKLPQLNSLPVILLITDVVRWYQMPWGIVTVVVPSCHFFLTSYLTSRLICITMLIPVTKSWKISRTSRSELNIHGDCKWIYRVFVHNRELCTSRSYCFNKEFFDRM